MLRLLLPAIALGANCRSPRYVFTDFHADIDVHATAYKPGRQVVLDKTYHGEGFTQGAKMFFGGAFAMKSAIRQSSLDAYKKIFAPPPRPRRRTRAAVKSHPMTPSESPRTQCPSNRVKPME